MIALTILIRKDRAKDKIDIQFFLFMKMLVIFPIIIFAAFFYAFAMVVKRLTKPNFTVKNIWITRASSGIGEFLTSEPNRLGGSLIISARNVK